MAVGRRSLSAAALLGGVLAMWPVAVRAEPAAQLLVLPAADEPTTGSSAAAPSSPTPVTPTPVTSAPAAPTPSTPATPTAHRPTKGTVTTFQVQAADAPDGARPVWVYRPGVPDSADLPVLYFLHGLPGDDQSLTAGTGIAAQLDQAFTSGLLAPFVVVAPDGNSANTWDPEWADSTDGSVRTASFVTNDLINAVEGAHRRNRAHRAVAGFSMGGYGAMNLAQQHPDLYGQVVCLAGYFHLDDEAGIFTTTASRTANTPDLHVSATRGTRVMLADGTQDTESVVAGETQRFAALLRTDGQQPIVTYPNGTHSWSFVTTVLPSVESFLETGWTS